MSNASIENLKKRIKTFEEGKMTGHWCYGDFYSINSKDPNPLYNKGRPMPNHLNNPLKLDNVRKKLIRY